MQTESMKKVRGKKFTILSSEWCEYYRDSTFQYGVSPCYRPLCCQNVTLTYIKLIIQCNFPFLFYRMVFFGLSFRIWCESFKNTGTVYLQERTEQDINCLKIPTQLLQSYKEKFVISIYDRTRNIELKWSTYNSVQRSENLTDTHEAPQHVAWWVYGVSDYTFNVVCQQWNS